MNVSVPLCARLLFGLLFILVAPCVGRQYITHEDEISSETEFSMDDAAREDLADPTPIELSPATTPHAPHEVAVVSWAIGKSVNVRRKMSERNHRAYAAWHGYAFHNGSDLEAASILHLVDPASWAKLYLVKHYLKRYPAVVWLDSDALIMNIELGVHHWVKQMGAQSMLVSADWCQYLFNMGIVIFRRSDWTFDFLERTLDTSKNPSVRFDGAWEQSSMNAQYLKNPVDRAHIHVLTDAHKFQAQLKWDEYAPGDWAVHNTWCPRNSILSERPMPARRSTWWDQEDCDRLFVNYFCTALPGDCPCGNASKSKWAVWNVVDPWEDSTSWMQEAFKDVCHHNIAAEINDPSGREPHPVCGPWCGRCLPGLKRQPWGSQSQILGPSWHRNRTLRYLDRSASYDDWDDDAETVARRRRYTLKQWNAYRRRYSRMMEEEEEDVSLYWLFIYGAMTAGILHLVCQYRKAGSRRRVRNLNLECP